MKKYKSFSEFQDALFTCNKNIEKQFPYSQETLYPILDGPLNPEIYFNSKIKIVWVLKEAFVLGSENENEPILYNKLIGKYWDFEFINAYHQTWYPIVYTSYGILNNFIIRGQNMPAIYQKEMGEILHNIAVINISKYQAPDGRRTYMEKLKSTYNKTNRIWLIDQLELLEPEIVIFGFTFETANFIETRFKLKTTNQNMTNIYKVNDVLYFDCWHPAKPFINKTTYCNEIILGAKEFLT